MQHSTFDILVIKIPQGDSSIDGSPGTAVEPVAATSDTNGAVAAPASREPEPIPGSVMSAWRDSWTFCKATAKALSWHHWVPWLGATSAILTALTATAVFTKLQENQVSTGAKVVVGVVAILATLVTALQSWTASRIKALTEQMNGFDNLHTKIERDIEHHATRQPGQAGYVCVDDDYATSIRDEYKGLLASMTPISNHFWDAAKPDVRREMTDELRRFGLLDPINVASAS